MKVSELRAILDNYPPYMEVITDLYIDFGPVEMHKLMGVLPQDDYIYQVSPHNVS